MKLIAAFKLSTWFDRHRFLERLKVVVRAEIVPRDFLQTYGNNCLSLTIAKIERFKKFHRLRIWSIFKGFDREIINLQE